MQIGDSGGIETTDYVYGAFTYRSSVSSATSTYWNLNNNQFTGGIHGTVILSNLTGNTWTLSGNTVNVFNGRNTAVVGSKTLSGTLNRIRVLVTGNGTFENEDDEKMNIMYQ